jgi:putative lipoprotein
MRTARSIAHVTLTSLTLACAPAPRDRVADSQVVTDTSTPIVDTSARPQPASAPWEDARRRGIEFRAIGQEPGWMLEIDHEKSMYLLADYGEKKITVPSPKPMRDPSGTITYDAVTEEHRLTVVIDKVVCHDGMSGEEMTHTVVVTLDGTEYRGCGRDLAS